MERSRHILSADETRAVYQMHMLDILMGVLASHLQENGEAEQKLQEAWSTSPKSLLLTL